MSGDPADDEGEATTTDRAWTPSDRAYGERAVAAVERQRRVDRVVRVAVWGIAAAAGGGTFLWLGSLGLGLVVAGVWIVAVSHEFVYGTDLITVEADADQAGVRETLWSAGNPLVAQILLAADRVRTERGGDDVAVHFERASQPDGETGVVAFDGLDHTVHDADGHPVQTFRVESRERLGETELLVRAATHRPMSLSRLVAGVIRWRQYAATLRATGFEVTDSETSLSLSPPDVTPVPRPDGGDTGRASVQSGPEADPERDGDPVQSPSNGRQ